jgi:antitoxin PrlF
MNSLTVTAKGQITLRKDLLKHLGVTPGQKVEVHKLPGGKLALAVNSHGGDIKDFLGCLERPGQPTVSIEDMNEAIVQGWAGQP